METVARHCRNCGAQLHGEFCCDCGQREGHSDERFVDLVGQVAGDLFDVDSRFWRTLFQLVCRPGLLSAEFFAGRRARYLPPLRLYLILSFFLLLAVSISTRDVDQGLVFIDDENKVVDTAALDEALEHLPNREGVKAAIDEAVRERKVETAGGDEVVHFDISNENSPEWMKSLEAQVEGNAKKLKSNPRRMVESMLDYAPQMMFVLLPLFALLIQLIYLFSPFHYLQHLVFALHYHAFVYLLSLLEMALEYLAPSTSGYLYLWALVYLPLALRRTYGSGWGGAFWKSLFIYLSYGLCMSLGFAAVALFALALL